MKFVMFPITNQLPFIQLILYCGVIELLDLIRAWYGPMPDNFCEVLQVVRHSIHLMVFLLWLVVALLKFWIVCIRKTVPNMDDNFVTTFITMASFMLAFLFSLAGVMLPQKPALAHVSHFQKFSLRIQIIFELLCSGFAMGDMDLWSMRARDCFQSLPLFLD